MNDAEKCRENGWGVGTRLIGDEGYGPTTIEITAIGKSHILAKCVTHPRGDESVPCGQEGNWTLSCRDWQRVESVSPEPENEKP